MNKIKLYSARIAGTAMALISAGYAMLAKAALDADVQAVASTTNSTLKTGFTDLLLYIVPSTLTVFLIFWAFKFVKRQLRGAAH